MKSSMQLKFDYLFIVSNENLYKVIIYNNNDMTTSVALDNIHPRYHYMHRVLHM